MRKLLLFTMVIIGAAMMASCNDEAKSTARIYFFGTPNDTIWYTNPADSVYEKAIYSSFLDKSVALCGTESMFEKYAESTAGAGNYAVALCHDMADSTYAKKVASIKLSDIKNAIWKNYSDSLSKWGDNAKSASEINLHPFKAKLYLISGYYNVPFKDYTKTFE